MWVGPGGRRDPPDRRLADRNLYAETVTGPPTRPSVPPTTDMLGYAAASPIRMIRMIR
nr:hypothetical protein JVH1_6673 [Rhodococcus sp. JVH1]